MCVYVSIMYACEAGMCQKVSRSCRITMHSSAHVDGYGRKPKVLRSVSGRK